MYGTLISSSSAPVTFVDYYRADYASTQPFDYQFYFVFLRENLFDVSGSSVDVS